LATTAPASPRILASYTIDCRRSELALAFPYRNLNAQASNGLKVQNHWAAVCEPKSLSPAANDEVRAGAPSSRFVQRRAFSVHLCSVGNEKKRKRKIMVGAIGFEPTASWSRTRVPETLKPCRCRAYKHRRSEILPQLVHTWSTNHGYSCRTEKRSPVVEWQVSAPMRQDGLAPQASDPAKRLTRRAIARIS
jgi:hypothetical protein